MNRFAWEMVIQLSFLLAAILFSVGHGLAADRGDSASCLERGKNFFDISHRNASGHSAHYQNGAAANNDSAIHAGEPVGTVVTRRCNNDKPPSSGYVGYSANSGKCRDLPMGRWWRNGWLRKWWSHKWWSNNW